MSELKHQLMLNKDMSWVPCYPKSEADKVITEKDAAIADLIEKNKRLANKDLIMASETIKGMFDELRHQKYKRCLAMASNCRLHARWFGDNAFYKKEQWALQWHRCWLELAQKFKEAK